MSEDLPPEEQEKVTEETQKTEVTDEKVPAQEEETKAIKPADEAPAEPSQKDLEASELQSLKKRADIIGIKYHPKIGLATLKERVNSQLSKDAAQLAEEAKNAKDEIPSAPQVVAPAMPAKLARRETPAERKMRMRKRASRLVRIRVTCMNPSKKAWPGEIFTVSNGSAGTFRKYVPFNIDNGWHIPVIMLGMMKERKFVEHYTSGKDARGRPIKRHRLVKEFAIEELPPLTKNELDDLRTQQALAGTVGKE